MPQRETKKDTRRADVKRIMRTRLYHQIRADLIDQLERNGTLGKYYVDLVDDYMDLWVTKCLLVEDIQERGVTVEYNNGGGQAGKKKNDSIEQRIKVNAQMLKILSEIGIKWLTDTVSDSPGGEPDDDDL